MHLARVCCLAFLICVSALAGPPMSKVTIRVVSAETGKPLDRASVVITFIKGRNPMKFYKKMLTHWETQTNQDGKSTLPEIPQGTLRVQIIAKDFQTYGDTVDINQPEQTVEIKLNPPQPQYTVK